MRTTPGELRGVADRVSPLPRLGRAVAVFIAVTFGFTWLTSLPLVLFPPPNVMPWYFYVGEAGPALGAVAATVVLRPAGGLSAWGKRTFSFVGVGRAVIVAIVSLVLYLGVGILVEQLVTGSLERLTSLGLTTKLALVAGSFWLGWLARLGRWSIIPVVLWHGGFDLITSSDLGPSTFPATVSTIVIVQAIVVIVILAVRKARH